MTRDELTMLQSLPVDVKAMKSKQRIMDAIDIFGLDGLYISYSGGKDSDVLYHLVKEVLLEIGVSQDRIPTVFCDTGLEWDSVRNKGINSNEVLHPKLSFLEILKKYGYPVISKEQSNYIYDYRNTKTDHMKNYRWNGNKNGIGKISEKWKPIVFSDFKVSHLCCKYMKKEPFEKYEKKTGRVPFLGTLASESQMRLLSYLNTGCNSFETRRKKSTPIGFWTERDILEYIRVKDIDIASIYGDIVGSWEDNTIRTTKQERTGCVFCLFGAQKTDFKSFDILKEEEPNKYDYCMKGGEYVDGVWTPKNGLGMDHVIKIINKCNKSKKAERLKMVEKEKIVED